MKELLLYFIIAFVLFFAVETHAFVVVSPPQSLSVSARVGTDPGSGGGGNNGGGGYLIPTSITFKGRAYPFSKIYLLKDGQLILTSMANLDSKFLFTLNNGLDTGNYLFSLYSEDSLKRRSTLFNLSLFITEHTTTTVSGIFISPTIAVDKSTVKQGNSLIISGESTPMAEIILSIFSLYTQREIFKSVQADANGTYLYNLDTSFMNYGQYQIKSKAYIDGEISSFSPIVGFAVGFSNIFIKPKECSLIADLNKDCKVDLVDFSILAYWYKKENPPIRVDLNKDKKVDIIDFSIMAYHWTG
jgi:hypothetical protein